MLKKAKMKKILSLILSTAMVASLAACSSSSSTASGGTAAANAAASGVTSESASTGGTASTAAKKNWKIAVVVKDSTNAWFVRMEEGVKKFASDTGLNAFQKGPAKTDAAMQVQVIQDLISQNLDALCVDPVDPAAVEPVLKKAQDKGILVICHEGSSVKNCKYDMEAFNNADYGAFIMDNLAKSMGEKGLYTTMVADVTNASHNEWADAGVKQQQAKYPNMTLLSSEKRVESHDNSETAYEKAKELFKKYPDLQGIMGTSSKDAPGVARAIEELGLKGKAFVSGTGMPNECRQYIKDGTLSYITLWDPAGSGYAMCDLAEKILDGESVKDGMDLGIDGYKSMKFLSGSNKVIVGSAQIVIDKNNIDQYNF